MTALDCAPSSLLTTYQNEPYSSSVESTATASSASGWSVASSQSSTTDSSPTSSTTDSVSDSCDPCNPSLRRPVLCDRTAKPSNTSWPAKQHIVIPTESRQNPRRSGGTSIRCPPALVRQSDRKVNFVDNLVDSSTQIVEAIWPLSSVVCRNEMGSKAVLPLRTFIQETLRRSRTSYSTLQVALYYLILIKPHVPKQDFTMEQTDDSHECRALQCGRRMFLAALILASKYLQDRNYSARAWSKISGLATQEINQNELAFLLSVNWKLHIVEDVFQRWTDIVLKFTPPSAPSSGATSLLYAQQSANWKKVILTLTPDLKNIDGLIPAAAIRVPSREMSVTPSQVFGPSQDLPAQCTPNTGSADATPTPKAYGTPSIMEPSPASVYSPGKQAPALGLLPTPRLTPQTAVYSTPAVGAVSHLRGKGNAMCLAMAQASNTNAMQHLERWTESATSSPQSYFTRRSSLVNCVSVTSSPESMISDTSRTSRSSSISSASSLASAPIQNLGVAARFRCAKLASERSSLRSAIPESYEEPCISSSPESYSGLAGKLGDVSYETPLAKRERDLDESEAARALQSLQYVPSVRPSDLLARKRSHPEFMAVHGLQDNVRGMLSRSKTTWPETMVRSQVDLAESGSPRKRVCCSAEAAAAYEIGNPLYAMSHNGPGIWNGILN